MGNPQVEEIKKMKIGDPLDRSTDHGPQNHKAHLEKLLHYCETGVKEGATLVYGGRQVPRPGKILSRGKVRVQGLLPRSHLGCSMQTFQPVTDQYRPFFYHFFQPFFLKCKHFHSYFIHICFLFQVASYLGPQSMGQRWPGQQETHKHFYHAEKLLYPLL